MAIDPHPWSRALLRLSMLPLFAALAGYFADWHWLLDLTAHFRWHYMVFLPLGFVLSLRLGRRGLAVVFALLALANGWSLLSATGPRGAPSAAPGTQDWTLLMVNIHVATRDAGPLLALIERESPDVVAIIELSPRLSRALEVLDGAYPTKIVAARDDPFGIGVWSRLPDSRAQLIHTRPLDFPSLRVELTKPAPARLWLTHPFPPLGAAASEWRDTQLADLAERIDRDPQAVVGGDFNATPWSSAYRRFRRETQLLDSAAGQWPWPTWSAGSAVLALPIDHVLHGSAWRVVERRIGPDVGSDHRPLIVRLAAAD